MARAVLGAVIAQINGIVLKHLQVQKGMYLKFKMDRINPTTINDRQFSGPALDRMQKQGITSTVVEGAIVPGNAVVG